MRSIDKIGLDKSSRIVRYGIAGTAVAVALTLRLALDPWLGEQSPLALFTMAVLVAALYGGRGPGLAASAFGALAGLYFFIEPRNSLARSANLVNLILFVVAGCGISLVGGRLSERKRAEHTLREAEARLELLLEATNIGYWELDLTDHVTRGSAHHGRIYGYDGAAPNWSYERFLSHVLPEDREKLNLRADAPEVRGSDSLECRIRRVDGEIRWIWTYSRLIQGRNGRAGRLVGVTLDITDRKRAEEAAQREKEREMQQLRAFVAEAPVALAMFDRRMRYVQASARWIKDYGIGAEPIRQSYYETFPNLAPEWKEAYRRGLAGEVLSGFGEPFTSPDGVEHWLNWELHPWGDSGEETGGIMIYTENVTARKLAEDEIRRLNAELEERVRRRTMQLELANRELEAFTYSVSHDLRTPLRGIDGWSLALVEDYGTILDEQAQRYLGRVRSEAQRMDLLIDDLLKLSRVGRSEMRIQAVDLTALATSVSTRLQEAHPLRHIEFTIEPAMDVNGDPRLMEIALTNLLDNAVKFTTRREVARIECGSSIDQGERYFFVRDNGTGFDMNYAATLFGPFQRMHSAAEFPGSGIGLATVQRVISRHGGRVWAEAQTDHGATFYFTVGVME